MHSNHTKWLYVISICMLIVLLAVILYISISLQHIDEYVNDEANLLRKTDDGLIYVTYTNYGYSDFAVNLWRTLVRHQCHQYFTVVCIDAKAYDKLQALQIPSMLMEFDNVSPTFASFGTHNFREIVFVKLDVLHKLLTYDGVSAVLYIDSDIACRGDIKPYVHSIHRQMKDRNLDVVFQCDEHKDVGQCTLHKTKGGCPNVCSGLMLIRKQNYGWLDYQSYITKHGKSIHDFQNNADQEYIHAITNTVQYDTFDKEICANGTFVMSIPSNCLLLHYNWMQGQDAKYSRMVANNDWI
jgi:hypothetical protein